MNRYLDDFSNKVERAMQDAEPKILAVGCGGAGGNTISRYNDQKRIEGIRTIAVNTDAQDLLFTDAGKRILIGKQFTKGLGAGNDPEKGEKAAELDRDLLRNSLEGSDLVFVTCGLGGGTGTGAGPVVADTARKLGALTVGVLTLPFAAEGERRSRNAEEGLKKFRDILDSVIIIPDDNLLKVAPDLSIVEAFRLADSLLVSAIDGIAELVTRPGIINLDFADVKSMLSNGGVTMVGMGESDSEQRAIDAPKEAMNSPLLEVETSKVRDVLINITGDPGMSLEEAEKAVAEIKRSLSHDAQVIWGAQMDSELLQKMKVLIIVPGVDSPWANGILEKRKMEEVQESLDSIDFVS